MNLFSFYLSNTSLMMVKIEKCRFRHFAHTVHPPAKTNPPPGREHKAPLGKKKLIPRPYSIQMHILTVGAQRYNPGGVYRMPPTPHPQAGQGEAGSGSSSSSAFTTGRPWATATLRLPSRLGSALVLSCWTQGRATSRPNLTGLPGRQAGGEESTLKAFKKIVENTGVLMEGT